MGWRLLRASASAVIPWYALTGSSGFGCVVGFGVVVPP
jgi:hypothetical protein